MESSLTSRDQDATARTQPAEDFSALNLRAFSVAALLSFYRTRVLPLYALGRKEGEPLSDSHKTTVPTRDVIMTVVKEATAERRCAFADLLDPNDTVPVETGNFSYVTYAWLDPFESLVMTLLYEFNGCESPPCRE